MLDDRKRAVLQAIVADYVHRREPVGSKALVERHQLGVSPATIRNDMAVLEEEGYIAAPHTSAGRIPTDKGYRLFVDQLVTLQPLSSSQRRAIHTFLAEPADLDDAVERTVRLLAQLTKQLAVVQYPVLGRSTVRHVELVGVSPHRVLVVLISDSGVVEQRLAETKDEIAAEALADVRERLNRVVVGQDYRNLPARLAGFDAELRPESSEIGQAVADVVAEAASHDREDRVAYSGAANLARESVDFGDSLDVVFEALEEQMVLLRLLGEVSATDHLRVRIGQENSDSGLTNASVVSTGYGVDGRVLAQLGVVGPTRMDYQSSMSAVHAVARYLGRVVTENG